MKLTELKERVDWAISHAKDCGEAPENITVALQIDGSDTESVSSGANVELHYDNDGCASGCVLVATEMAVTKYTDFNQECSECTWQGHKTDLILKEHYVKFGGPATVLHCCPECGEAAL